ncbi:restriction endonuclease subunit S [Geotalea uraniireducens]|uniref:Restriction modification system DNA specificity domain n=1 Tax=Geotalea uraniireducens (strain Rf4) TaxID=351605 RepID=A5G8R8_GEOUR|nr:restriction endonuclease subunit S [Geotalea uraniireducens]ABQ28186.1 restriction modification system DNA specificity domain [Geotalea uraniireducens Rf4]
MSEWSTVPFGQIAKKIVNGGTPSTDIDRYWNGNIPWITGADFTPSGIGEFRRFVSEEAVRQSATNVIQQGQLLLVTRTGVGKIAIAPCDIAISQDITGVYVDDNQVATSFLFHRMRQGVEDLKKLNQGTSINGIIRSDLVAYLVELPALPQQRRIAEILSTLDETIEQTEVLIAKMQQVKAGLMHDLFTRGVTPDGHLRPTREHAPGLYKESPLGWIPKEWEVERLGNILRKCGGYLQTGPFGSQLHAHEYQAEGVPVVMPQDINNGLIGTENIARIHEARANDLARHRMSLGDMVIARRGDLSRAAAIRESEQGWVCGTGCFLLRLGQSALTADFAAQVYRQDFVQRQIVGRAVGTTMPSLNNSVMEGLFFPFCDLDEQVRIVERLEWMEMNICALNESQSVNRLIKRGLMHDLMTGNVQVFERTEI